MAHSIVVDLLMRTGAFETDAKRAERALKKFEKQAIDTGKVVGAALAAGAVAAAYAFDSMVKSAADFKDLEETTGAQAEDLASLAVAAGTAGVEMQTLAGNAIRLTKSLTGVDDDSKAAGAAIKALGLDLKTFKDLDPVAQIDAMSKAFSNFEDGPKKSAVAVALWGKSGAEMIKVLNALEEQGGRTKILTQEQIEAADAYADAQAKAGTELKLYAQAAATQVLPAFNELTTAASTFVRSLFEVDDATGKLSESKTIQAWARGAAGEPPAPALQGALIGRTQDEWKAWAAAKRKEAANATDTAVLDEIMADPDLVELRAVSAPAHGAVVAAVAGRRTHLGFAA